MTHDLDHLREVWRVAALKWSAAHDRASRYEEGRRVLLDEMTLQLMASAVPELDGKMSLAKAEKLARTSDQFKGYLKTMYDAQREAQDLRIEATNLERCYYEVVGSEARERAELRLTGAHR